MIGELISLAAVLIVPVLAVRFARRRRQLGPVVDYLPMPPSPVVTDLRTPEQRAADQARFDRALPRGGAA